MKLTITAALIFVLCVFISTACPTIYIGDSGETCAAGFTLGIGHPPGYPLYTLISKIFSLIPLGDIAFRVNLLAVCSGTAAVLFIFLLAVEFIIYIGVKGRFVWISALSAAIGFAFSGTFWFECLHAKGGIYTLAIMMTAASVYFVMKFYNKGSPKYMYMAIYTAGFLPLIHLTTSLVLFLIIYLIWLRENRIKKVNMLFLMILFVIAIVTPVLYLIIRALSDAQIRWADINSIPGVIGLIMRKSYYNPMDMPFSAHVFFFKLWNHTMQYVKDYFLFLPFVMYGFYKLFKVNIRIFFFVSGFILINTLAIVFLTGNSFSPVYLYVNKGFYLISDMGTMIIAAFGLYMFVNVMKNHIEPAFLSGILIVIPVCVVAVNYNASNLSSSYIAYDHAVNIEKTLNPGDTFLTGADTPVFNIAYMKYVKRHFAGIDIYDTNANLFDLAPFKQYRGRLTETELKSIDAGLTLQNPGKVFESEFVAYTENNLKPDAHGIIFKLIDMNDPGQTALNIFDTYTIRDYLCYKTADIACREIIARYFISKAQALGISGDSRGFENYRYLAEKICPDNPGILSSIASVYFYGAKDMGKSALYLEKAVILDPYYMQVIRLLTRLYGPYDKSAAVKWARIYVEREWDKKKAAEVKKEFGI